MNRGIQDVQFVIKDYLKKVIAQGDIVVDATAGLGRDTLFLAQCVGAKEKYTLLMSKNKPSKPRENC